MSPKSLERRGERGQMVAIFAICLVAIIALTGLVMDGGDTFLQRRDMQNVADASAMAGAYSYAMNPQTDLTVNRAIQMAMSNGVYQGVDASATSVEVQVNSSGGATSVTVNVTKPHRNSFAGVVGFSSWNVSATATAVMGGPNGSYGLMPLIFNQKTFGTFGFGPNNEHAFDEPGNGPGDVPQTDRAFNWTIFCTANGNACNGNSSGVAGLIDGHGAQIKIKLGDAIGPLNAGAHTTLFDDLAQWLGSEFPVAIVNDAGQLQGFAIFHLTGTVGGSTKQLRGYFITKNDPDFVIDPNATGGTTSFGGYVVRLTN